MLQDSEIRADLLLTRSLCVLLLILVACGTIEQKATPDPRVPSSTEVEEAREPPSSRKGREQLPRVPVAQEPIRFDPDTTTSLGGPSGGSLVGGVALPEQAPGFQLNPKRPNPDGNFATAELANALLDAARIVQQKHPHSSPLVVGDLSLERGGPIYHHGSHQNGRDVDVLFFYRTAEGKDFPSKGIPIEPDGTGDDFQDLSDGSDDIEVALDVPRTWSFIEAFASQPQTRLARIFVVEHVRTMLLEYAKRNDADPAAIEAFERTTCQPAVPHDDHFHIRLFCSVQDLQKGCKDTHPIYPWHRSYLEEHGTHPQIALRTRKQKSETKKRTVSQSDAAKSAGRLHPEVKAFLERRKKWSKVPHPGRPFCK